MKKYMFLLLFCVYAHAALAIDLNARPDVQAYIEHISARHQFDPLQLTNWFNQVEFFRPTVSKVQKTGPARPTPFYVYRDAIITKKRIDAGVIYFKKHKKALLAAEAKYGVPVSIMLGILGIESGYGVNTGHYSAFQGLATLAFNHPTRRTYFTSELTSYLLLCREQDWDPLRVRSSFDGGLGLPQFMPSSYREYAVKTPENGGKPNLFMDEDTIASMGNYLRAKGWQAGKPIAARAKLIHKKGMPSFYPEPTTKFTLQFTLAELKKRYGVIPYKNFPSDFKANVFPLENTNGLEHWLAFHNFYVIRRYNNSTHYVMTAYTLGNIITEKVRRQNK